MMTDLYQQKKRTTAEGGFDTVVAIATTDTTKDIVAPKVAGLTLAVQRIHIIVLTGSAGKTFQLRAKTTTTVIFTPALDMGTAGAEYTYDFGPKGKALPEGETLEGVVSAAGAAAHVEVEGYYAS